MTSLVHMKYDHNVSIVANPFLCIKIPYLYIIPMVCHFLGKQLNNILLSAINLGYEDLEIGKTIPWDILPLPSMSVCTYMMKMLTLKMYCVTSSHQRKE